MKIKIKPQYKHLVQKSDLCGAACFQMVLFRRGKWYEQEYIAKELQVGILKKDAELFTTKLKITTPSKTGFFFKTSEKYINKFFGKHRLPYKATAYKFGEFNNAKKLFEWNLSNNNDIMINFNWKNFYNQYNYGHWVLASEIFGNKVRVCDPTPTDKSFFWKNINLFIKSMSPKYDGIARGFVIISKK